MAKDGEQSKKYRLSSTNKRLFAVLFELYRHCPKCERAVQPPGTTEVPAVPHEQQIWQGKGFMSSEMTLSKVRKEEFVLRWWFYGIRHEQNELTAPNSHPATDIPLLLDVKYKYDSAMRFNASHLCESDKSQKFLEFHAHFPNWDPAIFFNCWRVLEEIIGNSAEK